MLAAHAPRVGILILVATAAVLSLFEPEAKAQAQSVSAAQKAQIVPMRVLRAAVVKIPFLAKQDPATGQLRGVAPDLAAEMARHLGVPLQLLAFNTANTGVAALQSGAADVTFLAPTSERAGLIDFGPAFMEMEMTLIVPAGSPINTLADADRPGRRIAAYEKTAVEEMARRKLSKATIVPVPIFVYQRAFELIRSGQADGFADLRDALLSHQSELPGSRILAGHYGSAALAIGYAKNRPLTAAFVRDFTAAVIASGFVARAITRAGVQGAAAPANQ